jgi:ubiquinol-cytochrome c reductase iron-sulfur subunit
MSHSEPLSTVSDNPVVTSEEHGQETTPTRRDFMVLTASAMAGLGGAMTAWPLISSLNPAADVLALSSIEVNIGAVQVGQEITVKWRGKPVFIRHRTPKDIEEAKAVPMADLRDPQPDEARVKPGHEAWLIMVGICTHLGCVPLGQKGDYDGWYCPCHGSHYDTAGRIRKGPAPANLVIPDYSFLSDTVVKIG